MALVKVSKEKIPIPVVLVVIEDNRAFDLREEAKEMESLSAAAGCLVLATKVMKLRAIRSATYLGLGAIARISQLAKQCSAKTVIINRDLSVSQVSNLEEQLGCAIIDRSQLILIIFSRRAKTHEGKLQVELASCRRQLSRLSGLWTHLERQRGGLGLRAGPGEKQIELDQRILTAKIRRLDRQIEKMSTRQLLARYRRQKNKVITISLVGYTNAGKSSLFNILTGLSTSTHNRLFDTLQSTTRRVGLDAAHHFLLSDTVGFIRRLPHDLIAGFRATLQEVANSDWLIIVIDASNNQWRQHLDLVDKILGEIGAMNKPRIVVFNKIDQTSLPPRVIRFDCGRIINVYLSCRQKTGIVLLQQELKTVLTHYQYYRA